MNAESTFSFAESEIGAKESLVSSHPLLAKGIEATHELLFHTVEVLPKSVDHTQISRLVANQILMKIFDDFRCASLLGLGGYPTQTAALVSSLYESSLSLCYIHDSQEIAKEWMEFKDTTRNFRPIKDLTRTGMSNIFDNASSDLIDKEYFAYQQLCMAKHGNPIFQKTQGLTRTGSDLTIVFGPKKLKSAQHVIRYSLGKAMIYTAWACSAMAKFHVPVSDGQRILDLRDGVLRITEEISSEIKKERHDT